MSTSSSLPSLAHLFLLSLSILSLLPLNVKAAASTTREPFNITVSDQSPTITYFPSRSGPSDQTWNVTYSELSWSNYVNQTIGQGVSSHYTTFVGANASLSWWGTAVYLKAEATNESDLEVKVDDSQTAKKTGDGWMLDGLSEQWHKLSIRVTGNGGVRVFGVTFTTGIGAKGSKPIPTSIQAVLGQSQINSAFGQSTGTWKPATEIGGAGNQSKQTYNRLDNNTPGSQLIFQPPSNTSFVILYGSVNFDHGQFSVSLSSTNLPNVATSGESKDTTTTTTTIGGIPSNQKLYGASPYISTDQILYYANLDPKAQYTVTVENQGQGNPYWDISKVDFIQAQGGDNGGSSVNVAALAAGIAGGVVALILIATLLWFFVFKKKRDQRKRNQATNIYEDKPFEVDPYRFGDERDATDAYASAASGGHTPYDHTPSSNGQRDSTVTPLLFGSGNSPDPSRSSYQSGSGTSPNPNTNRLSYPLSSDGYGYNQSSSSSRHNSTQLNPDGSSGMILHNRDEDDENGRLGLDSEAGAGGGGGANTKSRYINRTNDRRRSNNEVIQERDAGEVIPPRYDPSWAAERSRDGSEEREVV